MRLRFMALLTLVPLLALNGQPLPADSTFVHHGWIADLGNGTYRNPILFADYSDPDVIRVNDDFYMVSSSFNFTPGMPVLHSKDLVNWRIVGHVFDQLPSVVYDRPLHGHGCWASSIRFHNGEYYVYYGDPDIGIFMSKTSDPKSTWEPLRFVRPAKGWIDPCPFWDDDGNAYFVHAWAKSRAGFNSIITMNRMSPDGVSILDSGAVVFDAHKNHPTMEGPKMYKRNGYYYIFAPAGGVSNGWQVVLRSKNIFGPYDDRVVLAQGSTSVNGPHQGGWVETQTGESWFVHFQERASYGRVVHLQPVSWKDDWPVMGADPDGDGTGEPVMTWKKPKSGTGSPVASPQTSDEFDSQALGLQWQWPANHRDQWCSTITTPGRLRLIPVPIPDSSSRLYDLPNLLTQKFPAPQFTVTTSVSFHPSVEGERTGLVVLGYSYSALTLTKKGKGFELSQISCEDVQKSTKEENATVARLSSGNLFLRAHVDTSEMCELSFSEDGKKFQRAGSRFKVRQGAWVGARVGLFQTSPAGVESSGYSEFEWFRIE